MIKFETQTHTHTITFHNSKSRKLMYNNNILRSLQGICVLINFDLTVYIFVLPLVRPVSMLDVYRVCMMHTAIPQSRECVWVCVRGVGRRSANIESKFNWIGSGVLKMCAILSVICMVFVRKTGLFLQKFPSISINRKACRVVFTFEGFKVTSTQNVSPKNITKKRVQKMSNPLGLMWHQINLDIIQ